MTGEMHSIDMDGTDSDGNCWGHHAELAKRLSGKLQPFDQYQGPYIVIGDDVRIGTRPYQLAPRHLGVVRLWLCTTDGMAVQIYNEANDRLSDYVPIDLPDCVEDAARSVL